MKKVHEEAVAALKKMQEKIKRYADRSRKETKDQKKRDRVLLSTKDLVFKERPVRKLTERYVGPYEIEEVVLSKCSQTTVANFDENTSSSQCKPDSMV